MQEEADTMMCKMNRSCCIDELNGFVLLSVLLSPSALSFSFIQQTASWRFLNELKKRRCAVN